MSDTIVENKSCFQRTIDNIKYLMSDNKFIFPLIVIVLMGYGLAFYLRAINTDDLDTWRFYGERNIVAQGRLATYFIHAVLNNYRYNIFFLFFTSTVLLTVGAIINAAFIKTLLNIDNVFMLALSAGLFVVFPIMWYIQSFLLATFTIGYSTVLLALANILFVDFIKTNQKKYIFGSLSLLVVLMSSYELYLFVFLTVNLFVLLFSLTSQSAFQFNYRQMRKFIISSLAIVVLAVIIERIIEIPVQILLDVYRVSYVDAGSRIMWGSENPIFLIKNLILTLTVRYFLIGLVSPAFFFYLVIMFLFFIINNSKFKFLLKTLIVLSLFSLSFLFGVAQIERMALAINYFMMFGFVYVFISLKNKHIKMVFITFSMIGVFWSAQEMNDAFEFNYNLFSYEKNQLEHIAQDISATYGRNNDIFVYGFIAPPQGMDALYNMERDSVAGRIALKLDRMLGTHRFDGFVFITRFYGVRTYTQTLNAWNDQKVRIINHLGNDFGVGNMNLTSEQSQEFDAMPVFPYNGYFRKFDNVVVVKLTEISN